ncbi:MAG TPA: hypothetical protein VIT88_12150 [Pyrinomonadaceae bacterium]
MTPSIDTKDSGESQTRRFGFGYETNSSLRPSTETARAEFLALVLEIKPEVVQGLFQATYPHFCALLSENEDLIAALCHSLESEIPQQNYILRQPKYIRRNAIRKFIRNWHSLLERGEADSLKVAVRGWATEHNLTADWCLDHALDFLREFEASDYRELALQSPEALFLPEVITRAWQSALTNRRLGALGMQYQSNSDVEERGVFSFVFEHERFRLELPGPFNRPIPAFKEEVEKQFVALGGPSIRGARKALQYKLADYLESVRSTTTELGLKQPPVRWAAGEHFKWLINYQITPCMKYREIARMTGRDEKTIREGIQDIARLVGLKLRSAGIDKNSGRPSGAKEKTPRRRVHQRAK